MSDPTPLPLERCSVCRYEPYANSCTCSFRQLLARGDITEAEAYQLAGIAVSPGDFTAPVESSAAPRQSFSIRVLNAWGALKYAWQNGRPCGHIRITKWYIVEAGSKQIRWCRDCGHTEFR